MYISTVFIYVMYQSIDTLSASVNENRSSNESEFDVIRIVLIDQFNW